MNKTFLRDINVGMNKSQHESNNQTQFIQSADSLNIDNRDFGINCAEYGYNIGNGDKFMTVMNEERDEPEVKTALPMTQTSFKIAPNSISPKTRKERKLRAMA